MAEEKITDNKKGEKNGAQVYSEKSRKYVQEMELKRRAQIEQEKADEGRKNSSDKKPKPRMRRREQENWQKMQILFVILGILVVCLIAAMIFEIGFGYGTRQTGQERMAAREKGIESDKGSIKKENDQGDEEFSETESESEDGMTNSLTEGLSADEVADTAKLKAMQYDYDGAIALLRHVEGYEENEEYQAAVEEYEAQKAACVAYPADQVTHVFFHTLIHDAAKAFDGDQYEAGYNQFMVTEYEFNSIIQQMYDKGYVMVFIDELVPANIDQNGNKKFAAKDLMLPEGKIPFVLSQDDVSYYHYMDGDGFATRLIVDGNGDVKNEYIEDDGSISVGDYDMVPLIDRFVEKHPDFSYHGQKGYVALTGYEGILGYRTDEVYKTKEASRLTTFQQTFFDNYPGGFDEAAFERECEGAKKVAEAMKAEGWKFASHTWGHQNMSEVNGISFDSFIRDTDRWETWVEPLIGETDTLIYAFGGDIRGVEEYSGERFDYYKQCGFDYFCGVDSAVHWMQIRDNYVRQARRNIDGYRMFYNPNMLSDLFDVAKAWDPLRPSSVPQI